MRWTHETHIEAPPEVVWALATAVTDWPAFMPTVTSVERLDDGPFGPGSHARIKQPGQRLALWTVTRFEPGREFTWESRRRGMTVAGTHTVTAEAGGSRNTLTIEMSGPLTPVAGLLLGPLMRRVLRTENASFAARAAGVSAAAGGSRA